MDSSTQTTDGDIKLNSDLFNLAEKLRIELQKKDKQLEGRNEEIKELSAHLDLAMSRANQVNKLEKGLVNAEQIIHFLWKSFPSPELSYYIKTGPQNGQSRFICAFSSYYLGSGDYSLSSELKFTKNSDGGSISIYLKSSQEQYLQINDRSSRVEFTGNKGNAGKFVFFYHQQNHHAAISVDISTLDGYFLHLDNYNQVVANSRTPPADKFLIIPVGVQ